MSGLSTQIYSNIEATIWAMHRGQNHAMHMSEPSGQCPRSAKLRFLGGEAVTVSEDDSTDLADGSRMLEVDLEARRFPSFPRTRKYPQT